MIFSPMIARTLAVIGAMSVAGCAARNANPTVGALNGNNELPRSCDAVAEQSSVYRLRWNVNGSLLPCEHDLQPNGVVVVLVQGGNPALARYRLETVAVRDATPSSSGQPGQTNVSTAVVVPAAPAAPTFIGPTGGSPQIVAVAAQSDTSQAAIAALNVRNRARMKELLVLNNARQFLEASQRYFQSVHVKPTGLLCFNGGRIPELDNRNDFWHVSQSAASLHRTMRLAIDRVVPPVTAEDISGSQTCVDSVLASPGWGSLVARGASLAAQSFGDSRARLESIEADAALHRDALNKLTFDQFDANEQQLLQFERELLLGSIGDLSELANRSARQDLTDDALTSVINALQQAARWVELVRASDDEAVVEASVDGTRGRSRNVVLKWEAATPDMAAAPGSQTVLVDRFKGYLLNVSGSAGFAGIRRHEILRSAVFRANGQVNPDSVKLVPNSTYSWGPALSTGLSITRHWRTGFYGGLGIDLMVLTDENGNATTRIAAPILHVGRDDTRLFFGPILGAADRFAFAEEDDLRIGAADEVPANLILRNRDAWRLHERLYIGVIVGRSSLDPTTLGK